MKRTDDYESRSAHLKSLTDEQLEARFWELANKLVDPMLKMGYEYTSPSIERSVLLRMGFSSIEAKSIVDGCIEHNLIGHGAGNVVYRLSVATKTDIRTAGLALCEGKLWQEAEAQFEGGNKQ
ncbi:MAG: ornithine aminomutase subunit alpha [Eubacteriales bacterium]|nr:ornithine aminomutase subunit alpha [Eubacteriales bacterium]MCI7570776.1 ornithine aminomutase subunit alpha [Clostridiales bacterium]MDD7550786.1 ornithine aminomutase subunit alpha [Clostridia bacterium]MDY5754481.1 ornithine aminomutase subunit alpha [Eubacteriales bacterium]